MSSMTTASDDDELAAAVHRVLATLTDLRSASLTPEVLRSRIALVQWLRHELGAVETRLNTAYQRPPAPVPASTGTQSESAGR
jgi:hypothetical protein